MECRDVHEMADSFLAHELPPETSHVMARHLEGCPGCRTHLGAQRALRDAVRRAFQRARDLGPTPEFTTQLRMTLEEAARQEPVRRGTRILVFWALAATVVVGVALGIAYRGPDGSTPSGVLALSAVGDHHDCAQFRLAEKPISLNDAAKRYGPAYRVLESLPPNDVLTAGGRARVLERHACVYQGRRFAHIVFEYRGERVSLLVTTVDRTVQRPTPADALPRVTLAGRFGDTSVVFFFASNQIVFFAGDVTQVELVELADAVAGPLSRGLDGT